MADKKLKKNNKNKKSYDNKLITWISVGLGAFVAIVVAVVLIITITTGYVAKVDGLKIYDYEYRFFLQNAMYELQEKEFEKPDNYDELTEAQQEEIYKNFWTEERKATAAQNALEDARQFKAQYRLARAAGHKLSSEEKANLKANISNQYNQYMSYGYTAEMVETYFLGGMKLSEYKDYAMIQATIAKYKQALKDGMNITDAEIKDIYDDNPDDYRTIGIRYFQINIGVEKPADDADQTKKDAYDNAVREAVERAENIMKIYNDGGTMSTYKKDKDGNIEKDKDGNPIVDKKDLSFIDYIKAESDDDSSSQNGGYIELNNLSERVFDELKEYALKMQWNEDRTKIEKIESESDKGDDKGTDTENNTEVKDEPEAQDAEEDKEKNDPMTLLEVIKTDTAVFVVRAEKITDLVNSTESEKGAKDSIKDQIEAKLLEEKAVAKLEAMVNEKGSKYKIESKKEDEIKEINKSLFSKI